MRLGFRRGIASVILSILAAAAAVSPALAVGPDAGQLLNQERQTKPALPKRLPTEEKLEPERLPQPSDAVQVEVKGFRFSGIEGLATEAELQQLLQGSIGQKLDFAGLERLPEIVARYLREEKGYMLVRAYLPQQDVTEGVIEIRVIVGVIESGVRVKTDKSVRASTALLEGIAARSLQPGQAVRLKRIERAVLLIGDLPGVAAQAALEKGDAPGSSRVIVNVTEGPLVSGGLVADNYGDRYTGVYRGTTSLALNDPFGLADQLSLAYVRADSLGQGRVNYVLPLWTSGLKLALDHSYLRYRVGDDLRDLQLKGWARTTSTGFSYALLRSRAASVSVGWNYEYLHMRDQAAGERTRERKLPVRNLNLNGSFMDGLGGGGLTSASLALYRGNLDLSDLPTAQQADAAGPRTAGHFQRLTYSVARLQRLGNGLAFYGAAHGQLANANLDSSQKIILGGPSGVRAYPVGEASADEGHIVNLELRYDLPVKTAQAVPQLIGFVDTGFVKLHDSCWPYSIASATGHNTYRIAGGGVGMDISKAGVYDLRLFYAHKIGRNPGRNLDDTDSDNHSDPGRVWLQCSVWF